MHLPLTATRRAPRRTPMIAALLLACAAVLGPGQAVAHADPVSVTCTGSSAITYSPGLTFTPRTSTYAESDAYSSCLSSDPTLTSGSASASYTSSFSCLGPLSVSSDSHYTVHWNNGHSSTFDLDYTDTIVAGVENVTAIGTVTSGDFTGASATFVWLYTAPSPLACLTTTGLTNQTGTVTVTILGT
ncbi:hypothetical protein [Streptomyces sp. NPDC058401]|uniref:hypothetical protein n=1 Tax=Streptomyces sp. NPDC058401 TaxID=3346480 RepID=UPI003653D822